MTDAEWEQVEAHLPEAGKRGHKVSVDLREVLKGMRHRARACVGWRMMLLDFPPWRTVYRWFRRFVRRLLFCTLHDGVLMLDRERAGREASPTAGVFDSRSVKALHAPG